VPLSAGDPAGNRFDAGGPGGPESSDAFGGIGVG